MVTSIRASWPAGCPLSEGSPQPDTRHFLQAAPQPSWNTAPQLHSTRQIFPTAQRTTTQLRNTCAMSVRSRSMIPRSSEADLSNHVVFSGAHSVGYVSHESQENTLTTRLIAWHLCDEASERGRCCRLPLECLWCSGTQGRRYTCSTRTEQRTVVKMKGRRTVLTARTLSGQIGRFVPSSE